MVTDLAMGHDGPMARSALLVMDVQIGIVERVPDGSESLLAALARAAAAARGAGVPVVYVRVAFRPGGREISRRNRSFSAIGSAGGMGMDDPATQIHPAVAPGPDDVVVVKKRVSAFAGSDLDVVLRSLEVDSLVLTGIATSGVVLSTLRQAADLDYELTVLHDGCADADPEVHRVLLDKVFPRQALVLSVGEWIEQL
jgi:nicotinamidase-related amidase